MSILKVLCFFDCVSMHVVWFQEVSINSLLISIVKHLLPQKLISLDRKYLIKKKMLNYNL